MKRILTLFLSVLLLLAAVLPLTSCSESDRLERMDEPEKAVRLAELAEKALTDAEQVQYSRKLFIKNLYFSSSCSVTEGVSYVDSKDDFGYLKNTHEILNMGGDGRITTTETGYKDGYIFVHSQAGVGESYFKAPADEKEYRTAPAKSSEMPPLGLRIEKDDCKTATVEHKENGNWVITYEGFSEARAYNFTARQHDLSKDLTVTHKPWDLIVTLTLNAAFEPTFASVEVKFHESAEYRQAEPTLTVRYDFFLGDDSGAAEKLSSVDLSKYTELSDMNTVSAFFDGLAAHEKAVQGEFTVDTLTTLSSGGETQTGSLPQTIEYANTTGGYRFTREYEQAGKRYELSYAGTRAFQTVYGKTGNKIESKSLRMIDAQARLMVADSMNPQSVRLADIESATLVSEGISLYRYVLRENSAKKMASLILNQTFLKTRVEILDASCHVEALMPKGKLESYTLTLHAESTVDGNPLTMDIEMTVIFYEIP